VGNVLMRVFSGVVLGYLLFELLWRSIFHITQTYAQAPASISFEFGAVVFGLLFAVLSGFVASFIGGRPDFIAAWMAGGLVALTAIVVMLARVVAWPQVIELFFMAPAVVVGGWTYVLRR
jgi:fructose-specific phosphotransferase system IIC component